MPRISEQRRAAQRQRILDAAMTCFERSGFDGASMHDIITESGLSAGAIYRYFDGKEALVEAVAAQRHEHERALLADAIAGATDPAAALRRFLDNFFDWVADPAEARRRRVTVYVWAHAQHNERLRRIVTEGLAPLQDAAHALTSEQWARLLGPGVDPAAFLRVVLAIIQGFLLQRAWEPDLDPRPYRDAVHALLDRLHAP